MTTARLSIESVDQRIEEFRAVLDRVTGRLVELDADLTWQLLERSGSLRGKTAERWSDASLRHDALWRGQLALTGHLGRLTELRGTRRAVPRAVLAELETLLEGNFVPMPAGGEGARTGLTGSLDPTDVLSIDGALGRMSDDYEIVAQLVAEIAEIWGPQMHRMDVLADEMLGIRAKTGQAGLRVPNELRQASRAVDQLIDAAKADPLSLDAGAVARLEARVRELHQALDAKWQDRPIRIEEIAATALLIEQVRDALVAAREQMGRWEEKVVVPDTARAALDNLAVRLESDEQECMRLERLQGAVGASRLHRNVELLLAEVREVVATQAKMIDERDELRGLLSAYRAKANAVGLAEDIDAENLYRGALETLYTAPCDLAVAAQQVEEFRRFVPQRSKERP